MVLVSGQGQAVQDVTSLLEVSSDYVRDVIHAYNERGFDTLEPQWNRGRPKTIGEAIRERICLIIGGCWLRHHRGLVDTFRTNNSSGQKVSPSIS
ncbi:hypothetical protein GCM10010174_45800 [Kutzneria viridogrisea]|uniref:Transposase n=1 Tax=Kutzneria viridogrisea TaxID=47990 RepID=A0ABR6BGT3_9PSEU|nr:transposase [Kutzneria viridogrisea]